MERKTESTVKVGLPDYQTQIAELKDEKQIQEVIKDAVHSATYESDNYLDLLNLLTYALSKSSAIRRSERTASKLIFDLFGDYAADRRYLFKLLYPSTMSPLLARELFDDIGAAIGQGTKDLVYRGLKLTGNSALLVRFFAEISKAIEPGTNGTTDVLLNLGFGFAAIPLPTSSTAKSTSDSVKLSCEAIDAISYTRRQVVGFVDTDITKNDQAIQYIRNFAFSRPFKVGDISLTDLIQTSDPDTFIEKVLTYIEHLSPDSYLLQRTIETVFLFVADAPARPDRIEETKNPELMKLIWHLQQHIADKVISPVIYPEKTDPVFDQHFLNILDKLDGVNIDTLASLIPLALRHFINRAYISGLSFAFGQVASYNSVTEYVLNHSGEIDYFSTARCELENYQRFDIHFQSFLRNNWLQIKANLTARFGSSSKMPDFLNKMQSTIFETPDQTATRVLVSRLAIPKSRLTYLDQHLDKVTEFNATLSSRIWISLKALTEFKTKYATIAITDQDSFVYKCGFRLIEIFPAKETGMPLLVSFYTAQPGAIFALQIDTVGDEIITRPQLPPEYNSLKMFLVQMGLVYFCKYLVEDSIADIDDTDLDQSMGQLWQELTAVLFPVSKENNKKSRPAAAISPDEAAAILKQLAAMGESN